MSLGQGVGMDGDEEVCLVLVGNVSTCMQGDEDVCLAGIDDLDVGAVLFYQSSEGQCHVEVDGLLFGECSYGSRVMTAVTGIDDQCELLRLVGCGVVHGKVGSTAGECRCDSDDEYQKLLFHACL